jgi:hypothetical protein
LTCVEPQEVFVITLDENRRSRHPSVFSQPQWKIARPFVAARCPVDAVWIGPNTEVADMQYLVEANPKRCLEHQHVLIKTGHCAVNVTGRADEHDFRPDLAQVVRFDFWRRGLSVWDKTDLGAGVVSARIARIPTSWQTAQGP